MCNGLFREPVVGENRLAVATNVSLLSGLLNMSKQLRSASLFAENLLEFCKDVLAYRLTN